ncbi:hypothetical protein Tco_0340038 [Tanacetum coccineum]
MPGALSPHADSHRVIITSPNTQGGLRRRMMRLLRSDLADYPRDRDNDEEGGGLSEYDANDEKRKRGQGIVAMMRVYFTQSTHIIISHQRHHTIWTTTLLPIPLPTPSPPLLLPSAVYRAGVSKDMLSPRKRLCIALGLRFEGTPAATDVAGVSQRMTAFVTTIRQDTNEIYGRLDDAQDDRSLMSGQLNMLRDG